MADAAAVVLATGIELSGPWHSGQVNGVGSPTAARSFAAWPSPSATRTCICRSSSGGMVGFGASWASSPSRRAMPATGRTSASGVSLSADSGMLGKLASIRSCTSATPLHRRWPRGLRRRHPATR